VAGKYPIIPFGLPAPMRAVSMIKCWVGNVAVPPCWYISTHVLLALGDGHGLGAFPDHGWKI